MEENKSNKREEIFSKKIRAGKKRTYFIDVRTTKKNDYYLTLTESKRRFDEPNRYTKHKIFLYKEDFNKFVSALNDAIDFVKEELLPDYDFEKYDQDGKEETIKKVEPEELRNETEDQSSGVEEDLPAGDDEVNVEVESNEEGNQKENNS